MLSEKLNKKLKSISAEFEKRGYFLEEDLFELCELNAEVAQKLEETKLKKMDFYDDPELNSVGITLEDIQIEFFVTTGEDEEGPWYEASAEIRYF